MAKYTRHGRTTGVPMHYGYIEPKRTRRTPIGPPRSREARLRLQILTYAETHSVAATCRHFGIARSTYYRWKHRYMPSRPATLENRSSRPHHPRLPTWTSAQVIAIRALREQYPRMGKDKLAILLARQDTWLSVSMVGRILAVLRHSGQLREPHGAVRRTVKRSPRPYAIRKPKDYAVERPGDLIQLDTMELHVENGKIKQQFTAVDLISRALILDLHTAATASLATAFLDRIAQQFPAPIRAIQVDGGSEFMATFEATCRERGIRLFVLPPRSPKLNGVVERTNRSCREEFYQCYEGPVDTTALRSHLHTYQHAYTYNRPHQALGYRTPAAVLASFGYL